MIKLIINKIDGHKYYLKDSNNNIYELNIEFYDLNNKLSENDVLFINEKLLKENNALLCYGSIDSKYGRKINSSDDEDILFLETNNERIVLKRLYG